MIRRLRRRHWLWMTILSVLLPLLLLAFLAARDFTPHDSVLPPALTGQKSAEEAGGP